MAIVLYFVLAAVVFALGYWQGYRIAKNDPMNHTTQVKHIYSDCVPICVSKIVSPYELSRIPSRFLPDFVEREKDSLKAKLVEEVWKYVKIEQINPPSAEYLDSIVLKAIVLVKEHKDGEQA